jgi:hypothetical protein
MYRIARPLKDGPVMPKWRLRLRPLLLPGAFIALALVLGWALVGVLLPRWLDPADLLYKPATPSIIITDRQGRCSMRRSTRAATSMCPWPWTTSRRLPRRDHRHRRQPLLHHPGVDPPPSPAPRGSTGARAKRLRRQHADAAARAQSAADRRGAPGTVAPAASCARRGWRWRLERRYSKDELLALYLNTTYYGHFAAGIEAASQAYFGVHARS